MAKKKATKKSTQKKGRQPVVAVMGHVDHGKTTFLDSIKDTDIQGGEAGGITQNTRAHEVDYKGQKITFLDTPGHEAFSEMRSRGAKVTDLVLLVVAADDGVQPQTIESIKFAKKSETPLVVAFNKIDAPGADTSKIKNQLSQYDVLIEEYGGDVQTFEISALKKEGLDELLEGLLLQVEMLELKSIKPEHGHAESITLESKSDNKLGPIALSLTRAGEIKVGDVMVVEGETSIVRAILDEHQQTQDIATESSPVWIVGLNKVVPTGSEIYYASTEKDAKAIAKTVGVVEEEMVSGDEINPDEEVDDLSLLASLLASEQKNDEIKKLNVVIRSDTQGTLDVVESQLRKLNNDEVEVNILSSGTGSINRKDIITAKNAHGIVLGFQVTVPTSLAQIVKREKVLVRIYGVIYELIEEVSEAMDGLLEPEYMEEEVATAKVKKVFELTNGDKVAGCVVTDGKVTKGYQVIVERDEEEVGRGKLTVLKRNKDEVKEVQKGVECGILIEPHVDIEEGDEIVLYKLVAS